MANNMRGVWSITIATGQDPAHVPHWIHISKCETPAVFILTSSNSERSSSCVNPARTRSSVIWGIVPPRRLTYRQTEPKFYLALLIREQQTNPTHLAILC